MINPEKSRRRARRIFHTQRIIEKRFKALKQNGWINGYVQHIYKDFYYTNYGFRVAEKSDSDNRRGWSVECMISDEKLQHLADHYKVYYRLIRLTEAPGQRYVQKENRRYFIIIKPRSSWGWSKPSHVLSKKKNKIDKYKACSKKYEKRLSEVRADISLKEQRDEFS